MEQFIGKNEYDFEALDNLPSGYINQIKNLLVNSDIKIRRDGNNIDAELYKENGTDNKNIMLGIQGGKNQTQYLYFNPRIFMFNFIPMSREQQIVFVRNMFLKYVANRITEKCLELGFYFDISKHHIEPRRITNPRY